MLGSFQHLFYAGRVDPVLFALWVLVVVLSTIRSVVVLRRPDARRGRMPWIFGLLLAPYGALALTILAFTVGHGHPLAQYNAAGGVSWFSTWVRAWPLLVWGCLGGCAGSFVAFVVGVIRDSRAPVGTPHGGALGGILVANILSLVCVFQNFPSA